MANKSFKNDKLIIQTPKGSIIKRSYTKGRFKGKVYYRIEWNPGFGPKMTGQLNNAQQFVDSEALRGCWPYIPYDSGVLRQSGILGTQVGSGVVEWIAPYAAAQYYKTAQTRSYNPLCGGMWFERWKADHGQEVIKKAKKIGGGG